MHPPFDEPMRTPHHCEAQEHELGAGSELSVSRTPSLPVAVTSPRSQTRGDSIGGRARSLSHITALGCTRLHLAFPPSQ